MTEEKATEKATERAADAVIHVRVPGPWYRELRAMAEECEGTVHQQARLAIRQRLEREGRVTSEE